MIMNDQQQLAIIVFFTIPPISSLTAAQANPREAATFCYMHVQQWQQWQWRKQIQVAGSSALRLPVSYKKNVLHCVVSRRKPTLEDCPWATPILLKVIWDAKDAMCKVWQPRAILEKFWRHKASSFVVLLP